MDHWSFYRHMPVHLRDGRLLGRVEEVGHAAAYLHIQQGHLLVQDWYVPRRVVARVTLEGVWLDVSLDDLRREHWNVPPESYLLRQGAVPGYEYTTAPGVSDDDRVERNTEAE